MRTAIRRRNGLGLLGVACIATIGIGCPGEKRGEAADSARAAIPIDTVATDLSKVETSLPPALPDTFKEPARPVARRSGGEVVREPPIPPAPPALMDAVARERTSSQFCYQEFGQKVDPTLRGGVAMLVTVGESGGITDARVANDNWSSRTGKAVNECLNEKAKLAWKLTPGDVKAGKYYVQLAFTGS